MSQRCTHRTINFCHFLAMILMKNGVSALSKTTFPHLKNTVVSEDETNHVDFNKVDEALLILIFFVPKFGVFCARKS